MYESIRHFGMNVMLALVIFIAGKWGARLASVLLEKVLMKSGVNKTLTSFTRNGVYFLILAFASVAALNKLGVETSSFIALIGAAGLAVGLAFQGTLANLAAGIMIIIFRPFVVGDFIETAGVAGRIEEVQIFSTILITDDKKRAIIPNSKITGDKIILTPPAGMKGEEEADNG